MTVLSPFCKNGLSDTLSTEIRTVLTIIPYTSIHNVLYYTITYIKYYTEYIYNLYLGRYSYFGLKENAFSNHSCTLSDTIGGVAPYGLSRVLGSFGSLDALNAAAIPQSMWNLFEGTLSFVRRFIW